MATPPSPVSSRPRRPHVFSTEAETACYEADGWLALWRRDPARAAKLFEKWEEEVGTVARSSSLAFVRYSRAWAEYLCHKKLGDQDALERAFTLLDGDTTSNGYRKTSAIRPSRHFGTRKWNQNPSASRKCWSRRRDLNPRPADYEEPT